MGKRKKRIRRIYEYHNEDLSLITFKTSMKIFKIFISIFIILFLKYIINTYNVKVSFKNIKNFNYNFTIVNNIQNKNNQNINNETLTNISKSFKDITASNKILLLRAKNNYEILEYYKSLKDCEQYLNLTKDYFNIEICHLLVLNYIKMFDLENAKEKLNMCEKIDKNHIKNKELYSLIENEEKKNEENIRKYKQYPIYLNYMKNIYKMGLYINKLEINFVSEKL